MRNEDNNNNSKINNYLTNLKKTPAARKILIIIGTVIICFIILRVLLVMVASNSELNTKQKNRLFSISSIAQTTAATIGVKISEEKINKNLKNIYSDIMLDKHGYDLELFNGKKITDSNPAIYYISKELADTLLLSNKDITLSNNSRDVIKNKSKVSSSFFAYTGNEVIACIIVRKESDLYFRRASLKRNKKLDLTKNTNVIFKKGTLFACSNSQTSWGDIKVD